MAGQSFLLKSFNLMNGWIFSANRINLVALQNPARTLKLETRERLKSLKIPEKPKKPLTPYLQFLTENRSVLLKENPHIKAVEVVQKLAKDWKTVSEEHKLKYKEKFLKDMEAYDKDILKYNANLTEEQREAIHAASTEKRKDKKKRKVTKMLKETHKPKKPAGPYVLYLKEQSHIRNVPVNVLLKTKTDWSQLSNSEKQRFKDEYLKTLETYDVELKKWEQQMLDEGHPELVRAKSKGEEKKSSRILHLKDKEPSKQ